MAATKHLVLEGGRNWDKWEKYISDFIDAAKSIYNSAMRNNVWKLRFRLTRK